MILTSRVLTGGYPTWIHPTSGYCTGIHKGKIYVGRILTG